MPNCRRGRYSNSSQRSFINTSNKKYTFPINPLFYNPTLNFQYYLREKQRSNK